MPDPKFENSRRNEFAERMCRESDAVGGAIAWATHCIVLAVVVLGSWWTLDGIRRLRDDSRRNAAELREFRDLAARTTRSPQRDAARVKAQVSRRIQEQSWHGNLDGVRPRVLQTETGLRIRLTRTVPGLERSRDR